MPSKTFVYRNLHKKCWSVKKDGLVIARALWVEIKSLKEGSMEHIHIPCTAGFRVNEKGRQRVIAEKRKNVHAFAWGYDVNPYADPSNNVINCDAESEFIEVFFRAEKDSLVPVSYNPYKAGYFFQKDTGAPVGYASKIWLTPSGVWVRDPKV